MKNCSATGYCLGHLGKAKTKRMLRDRYCFPYMKNMIDNVKCEVAMKETHSETIKTSSTPDNSQDTVTVDFGGFYRTGTTAQSLSISKRTRYPWLWRGYRQPHFKSIRRDRNTCSPPTKHEDASNRTTECHSTQLKGS